MLPKLPPGRDDCDRRQLRHQRRAGTLRGEPPDPMNLLGGAEAFRYPTFANYVAAIEEARPAVNVAALVGHTALRNNHMDRLDRTATDAEIEAMKAQLEEALDHGALGLSTGLAYLSANAASTEEVMKLAAPWPRQAQSTPLTCGPKRKRFSMRWMRPFAIGRASGVPVIVSHLKCAGIANWGRSEEVLQPWTWLARRSERAATAIPYAAGSSTLDLRQVDPRVEITITWSTPHPEVAGQSLQRIAEHGMSLNSKRRADCSPPGRFITASPKRTCGESSHIRPR